MLKVLLLSALAIAIIPNACQADDGFPESSWDRVPLYAHVSIQGGLAPDQTRFLAEHFDIVALTGGVTPEGSSVEETIAAGARAIKQHNPRTKVICYWCGTEKRGWKQQDSYANSPKGGYYAHADDAPPNVKRRPFFDFARQDVIEWWSDGAAKAVGEYSCDGIFVDGLTAFRPNGYWSRQLGEDKAAVLNAGVFKALTAAREKMGSDKLMIFNALHAAGEKRPAVGVKYLPATDGAMVDDFDRLGLTQQTSKEYMANTIDIVRKSAKEGKIIIVKAWPGFTWWSDEELMKKSTEEIHRVAKKRLTFPLACFLVAAEPNCYFCYTWGWLAEYGTYCWYPEFDRPLGPPSGEPVREGWTYQREFAHASVFVDLENSTAKIDWR